MRLGPRRAAIQLPAVQPGARPAAAKPGRVQAGRDSPFLLAAPAPGTARVPRPRPAPPHVGVGWPSRRQQGQPVLCWSGQDPLSLIHI
eukprot:12169927-Alexandrium_andersonii.AAC.1